MLYHYQPHDDVIKWKHFRVTGHLCGEFPTQRPVTWSFDIVFDPRLNERLNKQSWGWWFETLSHPLWRHCNDAPECNIETVQQYMSCHIIRKVPWETDSIYVSIRYRCNKHLTIFQSCLETWTIKSCWSHLYSLSHIGLIYGGVMFRALPLPTTAQNQYGARPGRYENRAQSIS